MAQGKFIHVSLLIGANSDEGVSFSVSGLDNETAIFNNLLAYRAYAISPPTARKLLELYPNDPAHEPPYYITNATIFPSKGVTVASRRCYSRRSCYDIRAAKDLRGI
jgi:hypothetical protein